MCRGVDRGFEFLVILNSPIDYFDVVPDLMKATRHHIEYLPLPYKCNIKNIDGEDHYDYEYKNVLRIYRQITTDARMLNTRYYNEKKEMWLSDPFKDMSIRKVDEADLQDFDFTDKENDIIHIVLRSPLLRGLIEDVGVYDVKESY